LISEWPAAQIAEFANRVGALVASRPGAIPDWTVEEAVAL
jgi:fructokinase